MVLVKFAFILEILVVGEGNIDLLALSGDDDFTFVEVFYDFLMNVDDVDSLFLRVVNRERNTRESVSHIIRNRGLGFLHILKEHLTLLARLP